MNILCSKHLFRYRSFLGKGVEFLQQVHPQFFIYLRILSSDILSIDQIGPQAQIAGAGYNDLISIKQLFQREGFFRIGNV